MSLPTESLLVWIALALPGTRPAGPVDARTLEDLESLQAELEFTPDDASLLESCGLAALDEDEPDLGIWYLTLALDAAPGDQALLKRVSTEFETFEYPFMAGQQAMADYSAALFKVSKACESKKLYANAVDLLSRLDGTRFEDAAAQRLERIYSKAQAVEALLASGIAIPTNATSKRRPEDVARIDAKHLEWQKAYEVKGDYYTVKTNMGVEMAEDISNAMEQINRFYRKVFNYKARGGSMRRCQINVYKSRAEFDKFEDVKPTVQGFYQPGANQVTAYDPRQREHPGTLSELWSTLFHEASHQFTHEVWPNPIPTWLNEGTSSYFEGTRIERGGKVTFNVVPDGRLRHLLSRFDAGSPTLEEVITHFEDGSYDLHYYPFGWGLTYFLRNYEDQNSRRIYLPLLEEFMESYKSGGRHDLKARFELYFVEKAKDGEVKSFEDFVARFEGWIRDLAAVHWGAADAVTTLLQRGQKQITDKQPQAALESFQAALRKRPSDPALLEALAQLNSKQRNKDGALYFYRQLAMQARALQDVGEHSADETPGTAEDLLDKAIEGMAGVDRTIAKNLDQAHTKLVDQTLDLARSCAALGLERSALRFIQQTAAIVAGDSRLVELADELAQGVDLRRFRRLGVDAELSEWRADDAWTGSDEGLHVEAKGLHFARSRRHTPESFRFEVDLKLEAVDKDSFYGLSFGINPTTDQRMFAIAPIAGMIGIVQYVDGNPEFVKQFDPAINYQAKTVKLAVDVMGGQAELYFNGKRVGRFEGRDELQGGVGVFAQDSTINFRELRLKY